MPRRSVPRLLAWPSTVFCAIALVGCAGSSPSTSALSTLSPGSEPTVAGQIPPSTAAEASGTAAVATTTLDPADTAPSAGPDGRVADTIDTSGPGGVEAVTSDTLVIELGGAGSTPSGSTPSGSTPSGSTPSGSTLPGAALPGSSVAGSGATGSGVSDEQPTDTTLPNKGAAVVTLADGSPVPDVVAGNAARIYAAAVHHDYAQLRVILGDRKFRYGRVGEGDTVDHWKDAVKQGDRDPLASIVKLFEYPAAKNERGVIVWPYVAAKDPATWDANDERVLAELGFSPEQIASTKQKGRYYDERLTFDPDGTWTGFAIGA